MCSRWAGLSQEAVDAIKLTEAIFGPRPTLVANDDPRPVLARRLSAGADAATAESHIGLRALAARLTGDHAAARELSQRAAVSALASGGAWGPAAVALAMDRGHGALLVDFARRLALAREDDAEACTWSLRTLIHTGNQALAVQLARRSPHPKSRRGPPRSRPRPTRWAAESSRCDGCARARRVPGSTRPVTSSARPSAPWRRSSIRTRPATC